MTMLRKPDKLLIAWQLTFGTEGDLNLLSWPKTLIELFRVCGFLLKP